jgi:hypothetical protein
MAGQYKLYTIRVTNKTNGRVDIHKNLSHNEVEYIKSTPTLEVEVLEVNFSRRGSRGA